MELLRTIAARLGLLHRCRCPWTCDATPEGAFIGHYGELVAASYLRRHGYRVLRRNFRYGNGGEVDIVCRNKEVLVFVEVKSTTNPEMGAVFHRVDAYKRKLLRRGARNWLRLLKRDVPIRFDIVEVYLVGGEKPSVRLLRDAFGVDSDRDEPIPVPPRVQPS
ncbi:MAG: YraN family protein [Akkermansia sp.]|nr:YraN family protein [Akkermansia sp.]